ncbi:MAG TPA: glycosyltransferase family 39 protein [bacterium]|nr:glycosyltransferase family 39 protein [bacterium]
MKFLTILFKRFWPLLFWGWSLFVFSRYFSFHNLFDFSFLTELGPDARQANFSNLFINLSGLARAIVLGGLVSLVLWRVGRRFFNWLGLSIDSFALRFCFETALGILCLNGLWMGLGLNGLWFKPLVVVLGSALPLWALADIWREGVHGNPRFSFKMPHGSFLYIALLVTAFLGLNLAQVLLPETYFDGLVYHLSALQFWDFHHGITDIPGNLYDHFPLGAELYLWNGFFLGGTQAAKFLNLFVFVLTALTAGAWAAEEGSLAAGGLTTASILFLPLLSTTTWAVQNDVFVAFFLLLFVYALTRAVKDQKTPWFIAAGLMGGMAWSAKYTALLGLVAAIGVAALLSPRGWLRANLGRWTLMRILIPSLLMPWLIKNYVFTGNPFYPYLSHWIGGQSLPPDNLSALMFDHETPWVMNHSIGDWLAQVFAGDLNKTAAPLVLAFVPFLFSRHSWKGSSLYLWLIGWVYLLLGFAVSHQLRLVMPAVVMLIAAMGFSLGQRTLGKARVWAWVVLAFGVLSFVSLARVGVTYYHVGDMVFGVKTEKEYLATTPQTQSYYALTAASQVLTPTNDRLLIVGDARTLYYPRDFYPNSVFDRQLLVELAQTEKDARGIRHRLQELGIDDLVVSGEEGQRLAAQNTAYYPLSVSEWARLDDLIQRWTDPAFVAGHEAIYRLRQTALTRQKPIPDLLLLMKTPKLN